MKKVNKTKCVSDWRRNTKIKLFEGFGSKCSCCGLEDNPIVYDFHHLNETEKEYALGGKIISWDKLIDEAKKWLLAK